MARSLGKMVLVIALVLLACLSAATAAVPALRHVTAAMWNGPEWLPALPEDPRIHYEPGAIGQARDVAVLLPAAIATIAAAQGRPFAHPVTIGVYRSAQTFAAANGIGSNAPVGTTLFGRVVLSPVLFDRQRQRLPAILTHELSHAHLQGWMTTWEWLHVPNWFKEGLAVMVSGGGGAEGVSEAAARVAIRQNDRIAIDDHGSVFRLSVVSFQHAPEVPSSARGVEMAYRQAGMFVTCLHDSNPAAFAMMMQDIEDGGSFGLSVQVGYGADLPALWAGCFDQ